MSGYNSSEKYIEFSYDYPTTYHVVDYFSKRLESGGFKYLEERSDWGNIEPGKYYTVRNGTSMAAFILGDDWKPELGVGVIAGHIDALSVKLKPISTKRDIEGYKVLGVAPYSGTLGSDWFERDLGLGGKVLVRDQGSGNIVAKLVDSTPHPIARISGLAPHFGAASAGPFDKEDKAFPVIGFHGAEYEIPPTEDEKKSPLFGKHSIELLRYVSKMAGVPVSQIVQMELDLYDIQKGAIGGLNNEFLFVPRLDDRVCCFAAIEALLKTSSSSIPKDAFDAVLLFDNEEVGSNTRQGAIGGLLPSVVERVLRRQDAHPATVRTAFANSIILSTDVAHLFNPAFESAYLENHRPKPNTGITIKVDTNAHYATDLVGVALLEAIAAKHDHKLQYFHVKNNARCGSTVGPYLASQTGARTIDIGIPQLSMHKIREATGVHDLDLGTKYMIDFFSSWRKEYATFGTM